ncbi:MAG: diguanylate cyclase [Alphaproteobacteria bacterium]
MIRPMSLWGKTEGTKSAPETLRPFAVEPSLSVATVPCLARVLVLSEDAAWSRDLSKRLRRQGFATSAGDFSLVARRLTAEEHPDIVIVGAEKAPEPALDFAQSLKSDAESAHIPVVIAHPDPTPELCRRAAVTGADDVFGGTLSDPILIARLRPLVRLATMCNELRNRAAAARGFGIEASDRVPTISARHDFQVLAVAENAGDFSEIDTALGRGFRVARADDVFQAASRLRAESIDALVVSIRDRAEDALYLCGQIRNNPNLFNLPVLLVADPGTFANVEEPYASGASAVLPRPLEPITLESRAMMLVRRQRLRREIRDLLAGIHRGPICDEIEGVFTRPFFHAYLDRVAGSAARWRKPLSLASFQVQNLASIVREHGAEAANDLLRQVAEWITILVRVEDLVGRNEPKEFCVVLPETTIEDAQIVVHRISGVLLNTQFGVKGVRDSVNAWIQAGWTSARTGDTSATLIERARQNLR